LVVARVHNLRRRCDVTGVAYSIRQGHVGGLIDG
jgi:hypothetical protein